MSVLWNTMMVILFVTIVFSIGYKMGYNSLEAPIVEKANDFVLEYCTKAQPLGSFSNNTFRIENGTIVFEEP